MNRETLLSLPGSYPANNGSKEGHSAHGGVSCSCGTFSILAGARVGWEDGGRKEKASVLEIRKKALAQ